MARLTIYKDNDTDFTIVSNRFIDEYMKDANDAQLKVYFYLLRMLNANQPVSVSGIADQFNHTEKDILRALKYWEKQQILHLDYDQAKNLVGVRLRDLNAPAPGPLALSQTALPSAAQASTESAPVPFTQTRGSAEQMPTASPAFVKPTYSLDQLREFKNREETAQLLFIAESYFGRPLTPAEIKSIFFFTDVLHFSDDLIDYLLQYCVERGKKDFKYIEKVAVSWAEAGITTPKQAQKHAVKYDRSVYDIMNGLGRNGSPTAREIEYINRWTKEYGFGTDIILEACERAALATDKHRFEYTEGILNSWRRENVHHKADIHRIDELYRKKKSTPPPSGNKFNQFAQNNYDFDALEQELLSN